VGHDRFSVINYGRGPKKIENHCSISFRLTNMNRLDGREKVIRNAFKTSRNFYTRNVCSRYYINNKSVWVIIFDFDVLVLQAATVTVINIIIKLMVINSYQFL